MVKQLKNITFDEIRRTGSFRVVGLISPSQDRVFDERGEILGKYITKKTITQTLVFV